MSLLDDIIPYIDGYGLVTPNKFSVNDHLQGSDNGVMFTAELFILLSKLGTPQPNDYYPNIINKCINEVLKRSPNDDSQDGPDNYYGLLAGLTISYNTEIAQELLNYGYKNLGVFKNKNGNSTLSAWLWRQPQLYTAMLAAANKLRFWHLPFIVITAFIIGTSCLRADLKDSDARRLTWLLIQIMSPKSKLCSLAAKLWFERGKKQFGIDNFMQIVASNYYQEGHPFIKYFITE